MTDTGNQTYAVYDTGIGNETETGASGDNTDVSIVGGSSLIYAACNPNLVEISAGDTVTWTNYDTISHTVTSGAGAQADGKFDSIEAQAPAGPGADVQPHFY